MAVALGVVQGEDRARRIFDQLRQEGFGPSRIAIRLLGPEDLPSFPETYDPVGAAQFFGTAIASLPATGGNLVGNSTTIDTSLSAFADILSAMAERERHPLEADHPPETRASSSRFGATVRNGPRPSSGRQAPRRSALCGPVPSRIWS